MIDQHADQPERSAPRYVSELAGFNHARTYCMDCGVVVIRVDVHDMFHWRLDGEQEDSDG